MLEVYHPDKRDKPNPEISKMALLIVKMMLNRQRHLIVVFVLH